MTGRLGGRSFVSTIPTAQEGTVINRTTLIALAAVTFALLVAMTAMGQNFGEGNAFLWTLADIVWYGFLVCGLALIAMTITVLVRSRSSSRSQRT